LGFIGESEMSYFKHSIVLSTHATTFEAVVLTGDFEVNLTKIAGWGYDGVELAVRNPELLNWGELSEMIEAHGLKVPAIGTGLAWSEEHLSFTNTDQAVRKAAVERIKRQIAFARRFDALVIIGLIRGVTPEGQSRRESMQHLVDNLRDCLDVATNDEVRMALEPLNRYETDLIHTVEEGLELIQEIGSPSLGLLLDTFHMNIEESSIEQSIIRAGKQMFHFHVADSNRMYPGSGHLDFLSILRTLKSTGYEGWISGEFMPIPDPDSASRRSICFLQNILGE
jgi:sugar phosphate isomerase/epimerase